jgi:hypothetical protein
MENSKYPTWVLEKMEKDKPSKDPSFWAKKGCKHCYGRGTTGCLVTKFGEGNTIRNEQLCSCVSKAFAKWQEKWYADNIQKR